jgi:hypothetical protein
MRISSERRWRDAPDRWSSLAFGSLREARGLSRPTPARSRRAASAKRERIPPFATLGALLVLTGFSWLGESPDTDARVFQAGDRAVVLGRLADCMSWTDRPVEVQTVPQSGELALLKLAAIDLLGQKPKAASQMLLRRYRERFPERKLPRLAVALVRGDTEYEEVRFLYQESLRSMIHHECPTGPQKPDLPEYQAPPPGVPGILDDIA